MEKEIVRTITKYVNYLENVKGAQTKRADDIKDWDNITLIPLKKKRGQQYYRSRRKGDEKFKYLGSEDNPNVENIKEIHYLKDSLVRIDANLNVCYSLLDKLERTDYDSIDDALPQVYRGAKLRNSKLLLPDSAAARWKEEAEAYKLSKGPWYPQDLKVTTADKNMVRSKSEGLIYNHYLYKEITFVYELPLELDGGRTIRHPDFTILTETDWCSTILHDHQGRYGFEEDRERYNNDMYLYWKNGFVPGVNIFYTFDDIDGGFDITVVQNIIDTKIRPV